MKLSMPILLSPVLAVGCAVPVLANASTVPFQQTDQQMDRQRNTQAYGDGFAQGQADARNHAMRNDQPTAQWTKDDDQQAYREGYDAGYQNIMNGGATGTAAVPAERMSHGDQQAQQFGYQDGLAAGREDQMKGKSFKPQDHDYYKKALHGWTPDLGTQDQFKQLYREGFVKGYEEGYKGTGPH